MHIYIHGFASSGNATKGNILKDYYAGRETVITPDFPDEPFEAVKLLERLLIESTEPVTLWGSSLGGFYAMYLTSILDIKSVLINPAIRPHLGLKKKLEKLRDITAVKNSNGKTNMSHSLRNYLMRYLWKTYVLRILYCCSQKMMNFWITERHWDTLTEKSAS